MDDFVAESPDLSAFLIKAMEALAIIAEKLGRDWKKGYGMSVQMI